MGSRHMRIVENTSGYNARQLRSLIILAHTTIRKVEGYDAPNWKHLRILVRGRDQGNYVTGRTVLGGRRSGPWDVCLTIPRPNVSARLVLYLVYHELMHVYGYRHGQFVDLTEAEQAKIIPDDYALQPPEAPRKPTTTDRKSARIVALLDREKKWQTRAKRARTALTKIRRSLKHYERTAPEMLVAYRKK